MSIDLNREQLIDMTHATKVLPSINGKRVSTNAIWRWCRKGIQGVHLEYVRIGRRIFTSPEALNRFANALADADRERDQYVRQSVQRYRPRRRTEEERRRSHEEADRILREAGL